METSRVTNRLKTRVRKLRKDIAWLPLKKNPNRKNLQSTPFAKKSRKPSLSRDRPDLSERCLDTVKHTKAQIEASTMTETLLREHRARLFKSMMDYSALYLPGTSSGQNARHRAAGQNVSPKPGIFRPPPPSERGAVDAIQNLPKGTYSQIFKLTTTNSRH